MCKINDYIFYRVAFLFDRVSVTNIHTAIAILSVIQTCNILFIANLITFYFGEFRDVEADLVLMFIIVVLLILVNSIRYLLFVKYVTLHNMWKDEPSKKRKISGLFIVVYFIFSIVLYVSFA
jgi:hypothetical protein